MLISPEALFTPTLKCIRIQTVWKNAPLMPDGMGTAGIALFTVNVSHLHYNVIQRGCEAISGYNYKIARNCLTYMLDFIVIQMSRVNREKGY